MTILSFYFIDQYKVSTENFSILKQNRIELVSVPGLWLKYLFSAVIFQKISPFYNFLMVFEIHLNAFSRLLSISTWNKIAVFIKVLNCQWIALLGKKVLLLSLRGIILNFDETIWNVAWSKANYKQRAEELFSKSFT